MWFDGAVRLREKGYTDSYPRLAYWVEGEDGPVVLFIHAAGSEGSAWAAQIEALRDTHRLVYFDHRGVGASRAISLSPSLSDLAEDAQRVLEDAGFSAAHVVGSGLGAAIALQLALDAPRSVLSLALSGIHAAELLAAPVGLRARLLLLRLSRLRGAARRPALARLLYPRASRAELGPEAIEGRLRALTRGDPRYSPYFDRQLRGGDFAARLAEIHQPSWVVAGGRDRVVSPPAVARLAKQIPGAELLQLPKAGHDLWFEYADTLNPALLEHISRNCAPVT